MFKIAIVNWIAFIAFLRSVYTEGSFGRESEIARFTWVAGICVLRMFLFCVPLQCCLPLTLEITLVTHVKFWNEKEYFLTDGRTRGHSFKLFKERVVTPLRRGFFSNRVIDLWNELPEEVVTSSKVDTFKEMLDKYCSSKDWLYNFESDTSVMWL